MTLKLSNVSLVVIDSAYHKHSVEAVNRTLDLVEFGDILLFSDKKFDLPYPTNIVSIPTNKDAQYFMWYGVQPYLRSTHALYIQWDSWVCNPNLWQQSFMDYDWIGARWSWHAEHRVGNGGFSLRSKRLLDALVVEKDILKFNLPEDHEICRTHRGYLEDRYQLKWGDDAIATQFSNEHDLTLPLGFGFHGVWNFVLALDEDECIKVFKELSSKQFNKSARIHAIARARHYRKKKVEDYLLSIGTA